MKACEACGENFSARLVIDGKLRYLYRRRFCLKCSPFGVHNTSKTPPGLENGPALVEKRRRRRNAKTYRWQKKHRLSRKEQLVASLGGRCIDCGYDTCLAALEFHHRDRAEKEFGLGAFTGALRRYLAEAQKCDLVCANCHRRRHLLADPEPEEVPLADARMRMKQRAVEPMGGACFGCSMRGPLSLYEFHHKDATTKDFGISEDGILRSWASIVAELAKCVMLCANCHREVHAGVRTLAAGIAEDAVSYAA
jgi:ribosomal protein L44E